MPIGTPVTNMSRIVVSGTDIAGNDFSVTLHVAGVDTPKSFAIQTKVFCTLAHADGT